MSIAAGVKAKAPRILVVEDEPIVASLIADVLRVEGMWVDVVLSGESGLAKAQHSQFDLTICDLQMPDVDGVRFYHELLEREHPLSRRILFITGDAQAAGAQEFFREHNLVFLTKPFRMEELLGAVRRLLTEVRDGEQQRPETEGAHVTPRP